ncbi:MAG: anti-sigma factor [Pseudomonadota bacterium]
MSRQERELDAAEYVVGTLSAVERRAFEASIADDADTRRDVRFWERAFGALNASVAPAIPPDGVFDKVETELFGAKGTTGVDTQLKAVAAAGAGAAAASATAAVSDAKTKAGIASETSATAAVAANDNQLANLKRSRGRWRFGAMAATLAALGLGGFLANERYGFVNVPGITPGLIGGAGPIAQNTPPEAPVVTADGGQYVAVVNASGDQPSMIVTVDAKTGAVSVRSLGIDKPDGKSLELWYVPEGQKAVSVGLVGEGTIDLKDITAKGGDLLAISLEPSGGSPTGVATGPVIYTGKLLKDPTPAN